MTEEVEAGFRGRAPGYPGDHDVWRLAIRAPSGDAGRGGFVLQHDHDYRESDGPYCWNNVTDTQTWSGSCRREGDAWVLEAASLKKGFSEATASTDGFALHDEGHGRHRLAWRPPGLAGALGEAGRGPFAGEPRLEWAGLVIAGAYEHTDEAGGKAWYLRLDPPEGPALRGAFKLVHDGAGTERWFGAWYPGRGVVNCQATEPRAAQFSLEWLGEMANAVRGLPGVPGGEPCLRRITPRPAPPPS